MRTAKEPKTVYKKLENRTLYIRSVISYYTINEKVFPALVLSSPKRTQYGYVTLK